MGLHSYFLGVSARRKRYFIVKLQLTTEMADLLAAKHNYAYLNIGLMRCDRLAIRQGERGHFESLGWMTIVLGRTSLLPREYMHIRIGDQFFTIDLTHEIKANLGRLGVGEAPALYQKELTNCVGSVAHVSLQLQEVDYKVAKASK